MAPANTTNQSDVAAEALVAELDLNGCVNVDNHITVDRMEHLNSELQPYLDSAPYGRT